MFSTPTPSLADISLYYQLSWGLDIAAGRGIENLTNGGTSNTNTEGASVVFNQQRYPALHRWYIAMRHYFSELPSTEKRAPSLESALQQLRSFASPSSIPLLLPTPNIAHLELDQKNGLVPGVQVSVAPDDTGRDE